MATMARSSSSSSSSSSTSRGLGASDACRRRRRRGSSPPQAARRRPVAVSGHLVGIDLGTTNSSVAVLSPRGPEVIVVDEATGKRSVPSVVALSEDDVLTLQSWDASHGAVFYSFKRIIGLRPDEISASVRDCLRYEILDSSTGVSCRMEGSQTTTLVALSSVVEKRAQGHSDEPSGVICIGKARTAGLQSPPSQLDMSNSSSSWSVM